MYLYNRFSVIFLFLIFLSSCTKDNQITDIDQDSVLDQLKLPHNSKLISCSGRIYDTGNSLITGWNVYSKTPLRFSVSEADTLRLKFNIKLKTAKAIIYAYVDSTLYKLEKLPPDTSEFELVIPNLQRKKHKIEFTMVMGLCKNYFTFNLNEIVGFKGAEINCGFFEASKKMCSQPKIGFIVDSCGFEMIEHFNANKYNIYNLGVAGASISAMNGFYPWIIYGGKT